MSFRNLKRIAVMTASSAGVADIIGAASLLVSEAALNELTARAKGRRLMDASQVIIRPVVSEKTFVLAEAGKYTFRVHDKAHKTQIRQAIEQLFDVKVLAVSTRRSRASPSAAARPRAARANGRRPSSRSARATRYPSFAGWRELSNADPQSQANLARTALCHLSGLRRDHSRRAGEVAHRGTEEVRWAQFQRAQDLTSPRRRRQAPVSQDRLQAPQGWNSRQGRSHRVRPQPLRLHRAAALRRRREALHPRATAAAGRCHRRIRARVRTSASATACPWPICLPARSCTTSS